MFCLADNDTTILHNILGLDKYIATVHVLDFSLLVLVEGGKDDKILRAWDGGRNFTKLYNLRISRLILAV